jgi:hypothetical protein
MISLPQLISSVTDFSFEGIQNLKFNDAYFAGPEWAASKEKYEWRRG